MQVWRQYDHCYIDLGLLSYLGLRDIYRAGFSDPAADLRCLTKSGQCQSYSSADYPDVYDVSPVSRRAIQFWPPIDVFLCSLKI